MKGPEAMSTETQEFLSKQENHLLLWGKQVAVPRGHGLSNLGGSQKPSRHGPGQLAVGDPAWAGYSDQIVSRSACQLRL